MQYKYLGYRITPNFVRISVGPTNTRKEIMRRAAKPEVPSKYDGVSNFSTVRLNFLLKENYLIFSRIAHISVNHHIFYQLLEQYLNFKWTCPVSSSPPNQCIHSASCGKAGLVDYAVRTTTAFGHMPPVRQGFVYI